MPVGKAQLQGPCRDYSLRCFYWQAADFQEKHENARTFAFGCKYRKGIDWDKKRYIKIDKEK